MQQSNVDNRNTSIDRAMKISSDHPKALELIEFFEQWLKVVPPHWKEILSNVSLHLTALRLDEIPATREAALAEQTALVEQMKRDGAWKPEMDVMCSRASKLSSDGRHMIYQTILPNDVTEDSLCLIAAEVLTCIGKVAFSIVNNPARMIVEQDPRAAKFRGCLNEDARRDLFSVFFMLICFPKQSSGRHHKERMKLVRRVDHIVREMVEKELAFAE